MDLEILRQIESLSSLSHRQLAQVAANLVWRQYASDNLILPHQVQLDLEGIVYRGKVQISVVQQGQRRIVDHIHVGESISGKLRERYSSPVELRAVEPTLLGLLPVISKHSQPFTSCARFRIYNTVLATRQKRLGFLVALILLLFGFSAWYWQTPVKHFLANLTYGLASYRLNAGDEAGALSMLRTSLDLNPRLARAYNDLGYIYYRQGRRSEALVAFQRAIDSDPTLAVAQNNLGLSYLEKEQLDLAREALGKAVALNPESAAARLNLGVVQQRMGQGQAAARDYRAALRLNSRLAVAQANLGLLYYKQSLFDEAQHHLELALEAQPDLSQARVILGGMALSQGNDERAWNELERAAFNLFDDPLLHFYLALWYEETGMKERAAQEFNAALALQPLPDLVALVHSHLVVLEASYPPSQVSLDAKGE